MCVCLVICLLVRACVRLSVFFFVHVCFRLFIMFNWVVLVLSSREWRIIIIIIIIILSDKNQDNNSSNKAIIMLESELKQSNLEKWWSKLSHTVSL